jgi:hypothetical protein
LTAGDIVDRSVNSDNDAKYVAQVAAHHKAHWLAGFLMMLGAIALLGAVIGIGHLVRTRRPALANVAGPLAAAGTMAMMGWAVITMGVDPALGRSPNRAAMVALYHDASNSSDLAPNIVLMALFLLGVIALSVGLWRARVVPRAWPRFSGCRWSRCSSAATAQVSGSPVRCSWSAWEASG